MTRYHQIICPHCEGLGLIRHHQRLERTCPLCGGKGTINDFDRPIEEPQDERPHRVHTCTELLARVVPLGGRSSGILLVNRNRVRRAKQSSRHAQQKSSNGSKAPALTA